MNFVEVNFERNGYSKVYFEGDSVVIDNGVNKFYIPVKKKNLYMLLIAIGEFAGTFRDNIIDFVVVMDDD